jgi:hypothetical protein
MNLGFYATLVLEAAEKSLATGETIGTGATLGATINLENLVIQELGPEAATIYNLQ